MTVYSQQILNGLINGSVYGLIAIGITLIFGLTGLVNFAHGSVMMIGAYIALIISGAIHSWIWVIIALLAAFISLGGTGVVVERAIFARTITRPINGFIISLGMILIIENSVAIHWGTNPRLISAPLQDPVKMGGVQVSGMHLVAFGVAAFLSVGLYGFLNYTRNGTALRCCNVDRDTAILMGINVPAMQTVAFGIGTALAGAGGVLLATMYPFTPYFGSSIVVKGFVIALAGGLGNVSGAFWFAMIVGVGEAITVQVGLAAWTNALLFGFIILFLMLRPTGLARGSHGSEVA